MNNNLSNDNIVINEEMNHSDLKNLYSICSSFNSNLYNNINSLQTVTKNYSDNTLSTIDINSNIALNIIKKEKDISNEMITYVFSELRNIISGILSLIDIIKLKYNDKHLMNLILQQNDICNYAISIMNDMLSIIKLETNEYKLNISSFNIIDLINNAIRLEEFKIKLDKCNDEITIKNDINFDSLYIESDKAILTHFFISLIDNSIRYTKKGSIRVFAKNYEDKRYNEYIKEEEFDSNLLIIGIADSGFELPPYLSRIIKNNKSRYNTKNTGYGLYLANTIAITMGSSLHIISPIPENNEFYTGDEEYPGTIVYMKLKTNVNYDFKEDKEEHKFNMTIFTDNNKTTWTFSPKGTMRVLIVDDQKLNITAILLMFKQLAETYPNLKIKIDTALSVEEAIRKCDKFKYDIITMDEYFEREIGINLNIEDKNTLELDSNTDKNTDLIINYIDNNNYEVLKTDGEKSGSDFIEKFKVDKSKIIISITGIIDKIDNKLIIYKPFKFDDFIKVLTINCNYLIQNNYLKKDYDSIYQNINLSYYKLIL